MVFGTWVWYLMPVTPALRRLEQEDVRVQGYPGLLIETVLKTQKLEWLR